MADKKKPAGGKKPILPAIITPGLSLVIGGVIGWTGGMLISRMTDGNDALFFAYLALMLLGYLIAFFLQIILHEGGHLICGLLTGYRFVSFNIFGFVWHRDRDGKLRMGRMQIAGAGGQCLMAPPAYNGGDYPVALYNLGGVLANLIAAALCALLAFLLPITPLTLLLIPMVLVGLYFALVNGIPLSTPAIQNDGKNLLSVLRSPHARRALWVQLALAAATGEHIRLRDMPQEWFAPFPEEALEDPIVCTIPVQNTSRLMDQLNFPAALTAIRTLLAREKGVLGLYRMAMTCDGTVCELLAGEPGSLTAALESKENQQLMNAMAEHPTILRTRYAVALLRDHDREKADKLLQRFEAAAKKHAYPQEVEGEREILLAVQNAALKGGNS